MYSIVKFDPVCCCLYGYNMHIVFGRRPGMDTMHFLADVLDLYSASLGTLHVFSEKDATSH